MDTALFMRPTSQQESLLRTLLCGQRVIEMPGEIFPFIENLDSESQWLLPLIFRKLPPKSLSELATHRAGNVYRHNWYKNTLWFDEMLRIFAPLAHQEHKPVYLKGAALSLKYYQDLGVRPMSSFDVFLPEPAWRPGLECLARRDWVPNTETSTISYLQYVDALDRQINVYHTLFSSTLDQVIYSEIVTCQLRKFRAYVLRPDHQLAHIFATIPTWDTNSPLLWIADAATVIHTTHQKINWDLVIQTAIQAEQSQKIIHGLQYLSTLLTLEIPKPADDLRTSLA